MCLVRLAFKRKHELQCCALADAACDVDGSAVAFDHVFHVAQAQAKPLHVVDVAGGDTIKPFKDLAKMFFGDADPIVLDVE